MATLFMDGFDNYDPTYVVNVTGAMGEAKEQPERLLLEPPGGLPGVPRSSRPRGSNPKHMPSVDELYGDLEKAGHVKIIRKKGRAPQIVWLKT